MYSAFSYDNTIAEKYKLGGLIQDFIYNFIDQDTYDAAVATTNRKAFSDISGSPFLSSKFSGVTVYQKFFESCYSWDYPARYKFYWDNYLHSAHNDYYFIQKTSYNDIYANDKFFDSVLECGMNNYSQEGSLSSEDFWDHFYALHSAFYSSTDFDQRYTGFFYSPFNAIDYWADHSSN